MFGSEEKHQQLFNKRSMSSSIVTKGMRQYIWLMPGGKCMNHAPEHTNCTLFTDRHTHISFFLGILRINNDYRRIWTGLIWLRLGTSGGLY